MESPTPRFTKIDVAAIALMAIAVLRIASTYTIYSVTYDEPVHVAAALQLVTERKYTFQPENPPLPRLIIGAIAHAGGMGLEPGAPLWRQVPQIFHANDRYRTNLVLARVGNLLFFVLAAAVTWWWARREFGAAGGAIASLLFTAQPIVLGYSGLATHDAAGMAGVAVSLLAFLRWTENPTVRRAMMFGAAYGLAILCKFSCIGYVPAACLAIALMRRSWRNVLSSLGAAVVACLLVTWMGYGFAIGRMGELEIWRATFPSLPNHPDWPLPAPAFFHGIAGMLRLTQNPWSSYLFGEVRDDGFFWYFPAAVALKTTIPVLLLALGAIFVPRARVPLAAAAAILAVSMTSHLNIGVRYVLPLYVPLSVAAAGAALQARRAIAIALVAWHCIASIAAQRDLFPYFNEIAARRPWEYLLDSNLDWGQDVLRLQRVLREKKIDRIGLALFGPHDFARLGFPPHHIVPRNIPTQGWVAVSETERLLFGGFEWLRGHPYQRVGKSIRLYYIP